jgi:hypothetical protein
MPVVALPGVAAGSPLPAAEEGTAAEPALARANTASQRQIETGIAGHTAPKPKPSCLLFFFVVDVLSRLSQSESAPSQNGGQNDAAI